MTLIVFNSQNQPISVTQDAYKEFRRTLDLAMSELTEASRRQYRSTLNWWSQYCDVNGYSLLQLDPQNIKDFITDDTWRDNKSWSNNTRKARLSHMRKFLDVLYAAQPDNPLFARWHTQGTRFLTSKNLGGDVNVRQARVLNENDVHRAIRTFDTSTLKGLRDRALFALLFFYGLRRFEAAKLEWSQINFSTGHIEVEQGKGRADAQDSDIVPTINRDALFMLEDWRDALFAAHGERTYCFPSINKADKAGDDQPVHARSVNKIIKRIVSETGVDFRSHDGRRTLITHMINNGARIQNVQRFARHKDASTTLRYAKSKEADELADDLKDFTY